MKCDWKTSTINDICSLITDGAHNSPRSVAEGMYMASVKDFTEYGLDFSSCRMISEDDYEKLRLQGCVPEVNDILVGKDGARFFEDIVIYRQSEKPALLSSIAILRVDESKAIPEFLYYTFKNPVVQKDVRDNYGSGSAIPRIVLKDFKRMPVSSPSIDEQRKLVSILVSLDEKIQNNQRINENLAQQAQAVFLHLFGNNDSLTPATIADVTLNVTDGVHNTVHDDPEGEYLLLSCKNIKGGSLTVGSSERKISLETFEKLRRRTKLAKGDVLISSVGTVGELLLLNTEPANYEFQRSVAMVKPNPAVVSPAYLYESLVSQKAELINAAHGAVQQCLFISDIAGFPIGVPTTEDLRKFDETVVPMLDAITANEAESLQLATLRDTLLPRLMSGVLDVSSLDL